MNDVFGRFFDVLGIELAESRPSQQGRGPDYFIFDAQTHYVGHGYDPGNQEAKRKAA